MTVYEQIKDLLKDKSVHSIVKPSEVKKQLFSLYSTNPTSIILSDYCYNRINDGIAFEKQIFEYCGRGIYKYLGENYQYTGLIYHKPLGNKVELIVGEWKHGIKFFYDEPIIKP